jgi:mono/diheme cytochrome c family protein
MMTRIGRLTLAFSVTATGLAFAQAGGADVSKMERGQAVYQYWCGPCHSEGRGNPGTGALAVKYKNQPGVPAVLADRTNLTPESVKFFVRRGVSVMPPFRKTEITDAELDALAVFLTRNRQR